VVVFDLMEGDLFSVRSAVDDACRAQELEGSSPLMQIIGKDVVYANNNKANQPCGSVRTGETFVVETELATGDWLHDPKTLWSPDKTAGANPCVCINVEGALPGDTVAIRIEKITPHRLGYMAIETKDSVFPSVSEPLFGEIFANTVELNDGVISLFEGVQVPARPMIGTIGTTISEGVVSHLYGGYYGGNMDVQEVCEGATLRLPVMVPGALINVGDVHARQSDGEVSAVEVASAVTMTVIVERGPKPPAWPRIEDHAYLATVALDDVPKQAFELAFQELMNWLTEGFSFTRREAYLLLGAVMEARCTRYLEPGNFPYICKVPKSFVTVRRQP
jgi:amidase